MHMFSQTLRTLAAGAVLALAVAPALSAPPGWELRNDAWVPVIQPDPGTPEGQVAAMIKDLEAGKTAQVIKNARNWLKRNRSHPLVPQVLLLQGDAEVARGNKYLALYPYEDLLNNFPTSELYLPALQREYDIASAFLKGYKRKFLGMRILPVTEDAITILDRIQDRQRGSALAERAGILVADYFYENGRFSEAIDAYSDFIKRYPYSQYVRKAEIRRAEASLATYRGPKFDMTPLLDARERLTAINQAYPQTSEPLQVGALSNRIYELEAKKNLEIARYYYRAGKKYASAYYYRLVRDRYPETTYAREARQELIRRMPDKVNPPAAARRQATTQPAQ